MALVCLALAASSTAASLLNSAGWNAGGITILWPSNGLLIGVLLCERRSHWWHYLLIGYGIDLAVNISLDIYQHAAVNLAFYIAACNMLEVFLASILLYRVISPCPDLTQRRQLRHLLLSGVLIAPAIASFLASFALENMLTLHGLYGFVHWFSADALGVAVVTPLYLSFRRRDKLLHRAWWEQAGLYALLAVCTFAVFWQSHLPLLYAVLPPLLLLGTRLRLAGSALGLLLVSVLGGYLNTIGHGPLMLSQGASLTDRTLQLQVFLAVSMLILYVIEVLKAESSRLQQHLQTSETRFRLLAEASKDIMILADLNGKRRYVSPAVSEVLGWTPEELLGGTYRQIVHPEDQPALEALLERCRTEGMGNVLTYRCRKKEGMYLWVETNVRVYRDESTQRPVGFVSVVRDVSVRKAAEEQLNEAFRMVAGLVTVDGLTGIANRRRMEEVLEAEWERAVRNAAPLSLLVIDVDYFKRYNDFYGHLQGDTCLREVAQLAARMVHRSNELLARYGGEEFVAILPGTTSEDAQRLAERVRLAIERKGLPHSGNPHHCVTVSIGCATRWPASSDARDTLFTAADHALYRAKSGGRNRVEVAESESLASTAT
ncbi:MAG: diguanylate cyclase [Acidobacteriota bacterium]|nr:diguanylate cyclase [Acidobacteriota bacterium]